MNDHANFSRRAPLNAAISTDGLPRHRFVWDDVVAMGEAGILADDARVELIGGELIRMPPKGARHEILKDALNRAWTRAAPDAWHVSVDTPLRLDPHDSPEPDLMVRRAETTLPDVPPHAIAVLVEIADSSLDYDLTIKARLYAAAGVPEYWVINARTLVTTRHLSPAHTGYENRTEHPPTATLTPQAVRELAIPELGLRLADLGLEPVV